MSKYFCYMCVKFRHEACSCFKEFYYSFQFQYLKLRTVSLGVSIWIIYINLSVQEPKNTWCIYLNWDPFKWFEFCINVLDWLGQKLYFTHNIHVRVCTSIYMRRVGGVVGESVRLECGRLMFESLLRHT